jgi:hypothetical protein
MGSQTKKAISQVLICSPYLQLKPTWKITPTIYINKERVIDSIAKKHWKTSKPTTKS